MYYTKSNLSFGFKSVLRFLSWKVTLVCVSKKGDLSFSTWRFSTLRSSPALSRKTTTKNVTLQRALTCTFPSINCMCDSQVLYFKSTVLIFLYLPLIIHMYQALRLQLRKVFFQKPVSLRINLQNGVSIFRKHPVFLWKLSFCIC